jgi:hypothetical protein
MVLRAHLSLLSVLLVKYDIHHQQNCSVTTGYPIECHKVLHRLLMFCPVISLVFVNPVFAWHGLLHVPSPQLLVFWLKE